MKKNKKYVLKLYITGQTQTSQRAIGNLKRILEEDFNEIYEMEVIDLADHPQLAENEKILATPTLEKCLPPPVRRIIGDLRDKDKVLIGLDLV